MTETTEVDPEDHILDDHASQYLASLSPDQRRAHYTSNGLIDGPTGLSAEEEAEFDELMDPRREGYAEGLKGVPK